MAKRPTIKGIFVNSHIKALRNQKGERAVSELEKRFGKNIKFKNSENVLVSDEVKIIEICLEILSDKPLSEQQRKFEAGKLHFKNFTTTPLAKIIFSLFKKDFKTLMLNSDKIAGHVFQGVKFNSEALGDKSIKVTMENNDYPLLHFKGLFQEWMNFSGLTGDVQARETNSKIYEYTMTWE